MPQDLTGTWIGRYAYAAGGDPVPFEAELIQIGDALEGQIIEPNTFISNGESELTAHLTGTMDGDTLTFVKRYDSVPARGHPRYDGRLLASGNRIEGIWRFAAPAWFTGTFTMARKPRAQARKAKRATISLSVAP
ncbi:MAG: hypothetical protein AAGE03_01055 [Pseudomonadota bacterium]